MPYKKNTKRKQRRRPQKKRGPTTKQLATRIKKLEHTEELKYDDTYNTSAISTTGTLLVLSVLAQGDDFNQRVGEEMRAKYINCKFRFIKAASVNAPQVRILLFWDKQTNGVGPVLLTSTAPDTALLDVTTIGSSLICPHNYRTKKRYKILHDELIIFDVDSSLNIQTKLRRMNKKLGGAIIKFADSAGTIASLVSRSLCFAILGDSTAVTDVAPSLSFRLWYTDS